MLDWFYSANRMTPYALWVLPTMFAWAIGSGSWEHPARNVYYRFLLAVPRPVKLLFGFFPTETNLHLCAYLMMLQNDLIFLIWWVRTFPMGIPCTEEETWFFFYLSFGITMFLFVLMLLDSAFLGSRKSPASRWNMARRTQPMELFDQPIGWVIASPFLLLALAGFLILYCGWCLPFLYAFFSELVRYLLHME